MLLWVFNLLFLNNKYHLSIELLFKRKTETLYKCPQLFCFVSDDVNHKFMLL